MPQIKPGHRLYLYRLFKQELGCGKQTALARAAEVLEQDGLAPEDLGCSDARQLFEQLAECVKVTVFKKGAIFVTLQANADYDRALEKAASGKPSAAEKAVSNGKSWKRKRGAKELKPLRPKHIEKKPEKVEPEPVKEQPVEKAETKTETAVAAATPAAREPPAETPVANEPQVAAASAPEHEPVAGPEQPSAEAGVEAEPLSEPTEAEDKSADADAARKAEAPEAPEAPKPDHEPPIKFTITYTPEPPAAPEPEPVNEPKPEAQGPANAKPKLEAEPKPTQAQPKPAAKHAPEPPKPQSEPKDRPGSQLESKPKPAPAPSAPVPVQTQKPAVPQKPEPAPAQTPKPAPESALTAGPAPAPVPAKKPARAHNDLPHDFYAEVRCPDEHLSALCQLLPLDVDPMATLEEDFRIARSTGTLRGTRSSVTFPLRFQRSNGKPVIVKLRRSATPFAGKHWALAGIEADSPEEVGFGALERKAAGPWAAFANDDQLKHAASPEDELAQNVVLGSWDALLSELAGLAAPEDWGKKNGLLREYLAMRWRRAKRQKLISMADDGSSAAFDTGLLTAGGEPIGAILEPHDGDIIWELTCFSVNAAARPAAWPQMPATEQVAQALLAQDDPELRRCAQLVSRSPRAATQAYDPVNEAVYVLVPARGGALALDFSTPGAPRVVGTATLADAFACARAVSSDQPAWLRA